MPASANTRRNSGRPPPNVLPLWATTATVAVAMALAI